MLALLQFGRYDYAHLKMKDWIFFFFLISFSECCKFTVNTLIFNNFLETAHKGRGGPVPHTSQHAAAVRNAVRRSALRRAMLG